MRGRPNWDGARPRSTDLLDVALRVATEHGESTQARRLLGVALRDFVTPQEAENKTKKILTHEWVAPPPPASKMIHWAIQRQGAFPKGRRCILRSSPPSHSSETLLLQSGDNSCLRERLTGEP